MRMSDEINPSIITVCTCCRPAGSDRSYEPGKDLLAAIERAAAGNAHVVVRGTQCLSVCKRVCTVSISGERAYTFLFGDLNAATDAQAVIAMATACANAVHGFIPWKDRPEVLRKNIIARVPPPGWSPEDGSAPCNTVA
jgi:predicted metal-binding protein